MRKHMILLGMLVLVVMPIPVQAQDATFRPKESPAAEEWSSPVFTTSRDTRLEWNAFPLPNVADPQFAFQVIADTGEVIDTRGGFEGMGFIEQEMRVNLYVTCKQLYTWEIRVFSLKAPPLTSQEPTTPTSVAPPVTENAPKTITKEITIAVYTALPPKNYLVPFSYLLLGVNIVVGVGFGVLCALLFRKYVYITIARKGQEE